MPPTPETARETTPKATPAPAAAVEHAAAASTPRRRLSGWGRVLVAVYAVLAIAATGRSVFQIIDRFQEAPVPFLLSALAGVVYIVAALALALRWDRVAWVTICFELCGVLVIGTITTFFPALLGLPDINPVGPTATVWSEYGAGYLCIPLVLPILGLIWLSRARGTRRG